MKKSDLVIGEKYKLPCSPEATYKGEHEGCILFKCTVYPDEYGVIEEEDLFPEEFLGCVPLLRAGKVEPITKA